MRRKEANGLKAAFCVYVFAFAALIVDLITVIVLVALGTYYFVEDCPFRSKLISLFHQTRQ